MKRSLMFGRGGFQVVSNHSWRQPVDDFFFFSSHYPNRAITLDVLHPHNRVVVYMTGSAVVAEIVLNSTVHSNNKDLEKKFKSHWSKLPAHHRL